MVAWEDVQLFNKSSGGVIGQAEPSVERCKGAEYQQVVMFECRVWAFRGSVGGIRAFGRSFVARVANGQGFVCPSPV